MMGIARVAVCRVCGVCQQREGGGGVENLYNRTAWRTSLHRLSVHPRSLLVAS
jgi:hypothetical protein